MGHPPLVTEVTDQPILRDMIMDLLPPASILNYQIATGVCFQRSDISRYMSVFRYVIPDRKWLFEKVDAGYTFTLICPDLQQLIHGGLGACFGEPALNIVLLVTKGRRFVPCDRGYPPPDVLLASGDSLISDLEVARLPLPHSKPDARRCVVKKSSDLTMCITMPMADRPTTGVPLQLSGHFCSMSFGIPESRKTPSRNTQRAQSRDATSKSETERERDREGRGLTQYAHAGRSGFGIGSMRGQKLQQVEKSFEAGKDLFLLQVDSDMEGKRYFGIPIKGGAKTAA